MSLEKETSTALIAVDEAKEQTSSKNAYWGHVASYYTVLWRILLISLLLFAVLFMLLFSRAFTYDSVFCFFKDLQAVSAFIPSDYDAVYTTYEEGEYTSLSYRGGVAFVNCGGIEVYSPNGKRLLDIDLELKNPRAVASRKYLVAYENGGTCFSVTNSYAELYRGETDFPIYGVEVSDSGYFALITASEETLSQVLLYDNNFNLIQRFRRASATVDVSLADNGKRIALLGAGAEEGTVHGQLDVFELGESDAELTRYYKEEFPLAVDFTDNRNLMLLTDRNLRCLTIDGKSNAELALEGKTIAYTANENGALLVLETDNITAANRLIVWNKRGNTQYDNAFVGNVTSIALGDKEFFLLSGERVIHVDTDRAGQTELTASEGATALYIVDDGAVRVVYPAKTEYLAFTD